MKCPACKSPLREKGAGGMTLDVCYGGCGGIWFDAAELERVSARAAATLHTIWNVPVIQVKLTEPRPCPRCPEQILERKWFSDSQKVEIDQCPQCGGVWLDAPSAASSTSGRCTIQTWSCASTHSPMVWP